MAKRRRTSYYDYSLLILVVFLVAFGLVMIYSSSSYIAQVTGKKPYYFLERQGFLALGGFGIMLLASKVDYRLMIKPLIKKLKITPATGAYFLAIALQILVLVMGSNINGATRWVNIAGITFQPSEFSKAVVVIYTAYLVYLAPKALDSIFGFLRIFLRVLPLILLVVMDSLSTAIIFAAIMAGICFVASRKKAYYYVAAPILAGLGALVIAFGAGFRSERFEIWRNIETHPKGTQVLQGLYAIASGGFFGNGLGQSVQKMGLIPEPYNDMIFSIICEELGLFGAGIVLLLFVLLLWRIYCIALRSPDLFGALLCTGVFVHIAIQVIINIAVVTNSIPATGVPLPFISYGGTSIIILLIEMGLVLSVSNRAEAG